jgi:predicted HicB family RNase H-like nuclease
MTAPGRPPRSHESSLHVFNARLTTEEREALENAVRRTKSTVSDVIREALRLYVKRFAVKDGE